MDPAYGSLIHYERDSDWVTLVSRLRHEGFNSVEPLPGLRKGKTLAFCRPVAKSPWVA